MLDVPRERWIQADGIELRALEWPAAGPPALLLHATSFCAEVWLPAWRAARQAGADSLHALALDQRGHGRSGAPADAAAYGWSRLAADLLAVLADLGRGPGVLVGHSSGGAACLAAAGMRPEAVRAVAVVEPVVYETPGPDPDADSFAGSSELARRARKRRAGYADTAEARSHLTQRFPYSGFARDAFDAYLAGGFAELPGGGLALRCTPEQEALAYEGARSLDLWPLVPRIEAPLLVVAAERSAVPPALLERLRQGVRHVRVTVIEGTTHFALLERPCEVGAAIGRFLAEVARP